ncbi:hypothetical protein [Streptomyces sp. NPDC006997]|uniref:hypothetical protein n=1 Tax=Streptomyces sp. NPDC006997 TaxID=3155356 RepID=UPI0033F37390
MRAHARVVPRRLAVAAAGLAGAFLLGACSDDGGSEADDGTPSPSVSVSASSSSTAETGGPTASGDLEGSWLATTGGDAVALVVTGDEAGLFATGGTVCSGKAGETSGTQTIRLTCTDGSDDRKTGRVESVDGTTLKVTWEGGLGTETYTKAEGGQLPTGLPTEGLGS